MSRRTESGQAVVTWLAVLAVAALLVAKGSAQLASIGKVVLLVGIGGPVLFLVVFKLRQWELHEARKAKEAAELERVRTENERRIAGWKAEARKAEAQRERAPGRHAMKQEALRKAMQDFQNNA